MTALGKNKIVERVKVVVSVGKRMGEVHRSSTRVSCIMDDKRLCKILYGDFGFKRS